MKKLIIEPHYLGCLEFYTLLQQYDEIVFEVSDKFLKQTYRNRAYLLGANGVQMLSIPLVYDSKSLMKDVRIDYNQRWVKDHWGAFYSAYGKAPFFEYFEADLHRIWEKKYDFLIDLNFEMIQYLSKVVGFPKKFVLTNHYEEEIEGVDFRNSITPKKTFENRNIYQSVSYSQLFGEAFVPNLSIIDLIMCCGREAIQILNHSISDKK